MRGPTTCFRRAAGSRRMGCITLSTPEAELYAALFALRMYGIIALTFWGIVLQRPDIVLQFHEDNQTMIRVMTTGRNFQMRYATRTARLPIAWMHERFNQGDIPKTRIVCANGTIYLHKSFHRRREVVICMLTN